MELTSEQAAAVHRRDSSLLVRAGAGTGKTSVLVERFVRAVLEDGVEVDSILAITFTDKAASQLRARVRKQFLALGRRDKAREAESAWISTIHGFCSRLLRAHALSAGIDPEYQVLDELAAERMAIDAFDRALEDFLGVGADPQRLEMVAAYKPDALAQMVRTAHGWLRSRGVAPELPDVPEPRLAGEDARLEGAARAALAALSSGGEGVRVTEAMERLQECLDELAGLDAGQLGRDERFARFKLSRQGKALTGPECEAFEQARAAYHALCLGRREYLTRVLLRELLGLFGERYERLKAEQSSLDFDDLELLARDLLVADEGLRARYRERFSHVMVDEFQDTNPLQNELLELLERDNLFRVGDERQSIYGFRHADVSVFQDHAQRAEATGRVERLTVNFRSSPGVLDAIDLAFGRVWEDFEPLVPPGRDGREAEPSVELLVVDRTLHCWDELAEAHPDPFGESLRKATLWRAAEARLLAKRIDELTRQGPHEYRDVVVLLRATTHIGFYERALEERGIPTYVLGGRGYWSQQQVADLRAYLAALANPRDELALYSVLASPLVGASLDGLAALGLHARESGHDPWRALDEAFGPDRPSNGLAAALPERDRAAIAEFVERFREERAAAPRISLETLIDRAVTRSGYDRAVLRLPAGDRRLANVRKLMRLAREFEADAGRDLRGFIDFVAERDLIQEREGQAPLEAEQLDAVRLMTIHRAKGLEFPVVCLADLGKDGREDTGHLRLTESGELGLRLASLGSDAVDTKALEQIKERQKEEAEAEERRIFYVACTRARERLLLSGATDMRSLPEPGALKEPMRWVWRAFAPGWPDTGAEGEALDAYGGREVRVRCRTLAPDTLEALLPEADRRPAIPVTEASQPVAAPPERATVAPAQAVHLSRLSYSGLEGFKRCGYRFYLERVLKLAGEREAREREAAEREVAASSPEAGSREPATLPALVRGSIVHELLEGLDFRRPTAPSRAEVEARLAAHGLPVGDAAVADIRGMVEGFAASATSGRLAAARRVRTELPFAYTLAGLLVNGVVDVHAEEGDRTLVVDYKSDFVGNLDLAAYCEQRYATQRLVYALAALHSRAERVEVAYVFLERPEEPVAAVFEQADVTRLEAELSGLAAGVVEGRFVPSEEPHRDLCAGCPGRAALCVHDLELTSRELPVAAE